jgi:hypothetical protein
MRYEKRMRVQSGILVAIGVAGSYVLGATPFAMVCVAACVAVTEYLVSRDKGSA